MGRKGDGDTVSLFPFMSILACVIGILMLMITAVALAQIGKDKSNATDEAARAKEEAAAAARVAEFRQIQASIATQRKEHEALNLLLAQSDKAQKELDDARKELAQLEAARKAEAEKAKQENQEIAKRQAEAARLQALITKLEADLKTVVVSLDKLQAEIEDRKKPPEEAQVIVQPSGTGANIIPTFVECAASSVVLFTGGEATRVPRSQLAQSKDFASVLARLKDKPNQSLIFLVRPDGISTYNTARNIARGQYVKNGKLAIASQGMIDLSRYQNP